MEKGGEVQLKIEETVLGSQDVAQDITSRARLSESIEKVAVDLLGIPKTGSKATKEDEVERQLDTEANKNRGQSPVTMETDLTKPGLESSNQAPPDGPLGQDKSCEEAQEPKTVAKVVSKVSQAKENSRDMKPLQVTQDTGTIAQNAPSNSKLIAKGVLATRKRKKGAKSVAKGGDEQLVGSSSADTAASRLSDGALVDEAKSKGNTANKKTPPEVDEPKDKNGEEPRGPGPFFYIGGANGAGLVSLYCRSKGWQRIHDNKREDYKLKWCETKSRETYYNFKEGEQLLYQIPNNKVLTTKIGLLSNLREYERVMNKISKNLNLRFSQKILKMEDFFPESFRLDIKDEREAFFELYKDTQIWICKPTSSNQGRGIFLLKNQAGVKSLQARLQSIEEDPLYKKVPYKAPQARIVQRYIQKPLLLEGKKFDVRSYLLIACTVPYVLFFGHGYVRLTCTRYDATSDDLTAHLTNQYMQKKNPLYSQLKEETVWQMEHFNSYVNDKFKQAKGLPKDWVLTVFTKRMQQIMIQCFLAVKSKLECKLGYFDLIGCDFLIDEDFKVWLLEMNANPALHTNCSVLQDVIPTVVNETLDLVLEIFHKLLKGQRILPLQKLCHFVLLHNGSAPEAGAKASKTRNSVGLTRSQRSLLESSSHFVQHPSKAAEKSPKKPSGSGETTISTPQRVSQRTVLTMPQVQITDIHRGYACHPFKPPVQSGQVSRTCSQYIIKPVLFSEESSLAKPSTDDGSGKDMANAINSTAAASKENTYSVWLQQTFRIKSPTSTKEDLAFTSSQKVSLHLQSKVSDGSPCLEDHPKSFCRLLTHPMAKETPLTIDSKALAASQYAEPPPDHQKKVSRRGS